MGKFFYNRSDAVVFVLLLIWILFWALILLWPAKANAEIKAYNAQTVTEIEFPESNSGALERYDTYVADNPAELLNTLTAPNYNVNNPRQFKRILQVQVQDAEPGDIILANAQVGMTSELNDVEFSGALVLTPDSTGTAGIIDVVGNQFCLGCGEEPSSGVFITRFPGYNVSIARHHDIMNWGGSVIVPEGMSGDLYVIAVVYAASRSNWSYHPSSQSVSIDPHSGSISATLIRKAGT
jgi:hypothetical protein